MDIKYSLFLNFIFYSFYKVIKSKNDRKSFVNDFQVLLTFQINFTKNLMNLVLLWTVKSLFYHVILNEHLAVNVFLSLISTGLSVASLEARNLRNYLPYKLYIYAYVYTHHIGTFLENKYSMTSILDFRASSPSDPLCFCDATDVAWTEIIAQLLRHRLNVDGKVKIKCFSSQNKAKAP